MNISKKYIIIFGTLILSLVVITGAITYYNERKGQVQVPDIPDIGQDVISFFRPNPVNTEELLGFIDFCKNSLFSDTEELKNKEIKEVVCTIERDIKRLVLNEKTRLISAYFPSISLLDSISSFNPDRYIGISVDLKDVVRKYNPALLGEEKLYFCNISEPSWEDPFDLQIAPEQNLFFPEGSVCCAWLKMDKAPTMNFFGFIPQAESLNIKHYLVDEQTVSDVMNKQSFSEIKEILKDYPVIWQMEKPIVP